MNPIKINALFGETPEGVPFEKRNHRLTVLFGIAAASVINLPGTPVENNAVRGFFFSNASAVSDALFRINETVPFNVDRALEIGYVLFARRYEIAYRIQPIWFVAEGNPLHDELIRVAPEVAELDVYGNNTLNKAADFLRECLKSE